MFSSICKLSTKLNNRSVVGTLSRGIVQHRASMEEYFKDKRFIVTGSSGGKYKIMNFLKNEKNILLYIIYKILKLKLQKNI